MAEAKTEFEGRGKVVLVNLQDRVWGPMSIQVKLMDDVLNNRVKVKTTYKILP